jgi:hypothetical protein
MFTVRSEQFTNKKMRAQVHSSSGPDTKKVFGSNAQRKCVYSAIFKNLIRTYDLVNIESET